jgi:hypothetical protein
MNIEEHSESVRSLQSSDARWLTQPCRIRIDDSRAVANLHEVPPQSDHGRPSLDLPWSAYFATFISGLVLIPAFGERRH